MTTMMTTYLQDTTPLLNDWSVISTASGVYKKIYKVVTTKRMRVNMPASQVQCRIQCLE